MNEERKKPLLPDGSEVYIGAALGVFVGFALLFIDFPAWSYIAAAGIAFLLGTYGVQLWSEDDRAYWKARDMADAIESILEELSETWARKVVDATVRTDIREGVENARLTLVELKKLRPTKYYGGVSELNFHIQHIFQVVPEYVDLQNHPQKGGARYDDLMEASAKAVDGFAQKMVLLLQQANAGDVSNLTRNAEMLAALRNLLGKDPRKEYKR